VEERALFWKKRELRDRGRGKHECSPHFSTSVVESALGVSRELRHDIFHAIPEVGVVAQTGCDLPDGVEDSRMVPAAVDLTDLLEWGPKELTHHIHRHVSGLGDISRTRLGGEGFGADAPSVRDQARDAIRRRNWSAVALFELTERQNPFGEREGDLLVPNG
jgi:hypothetical protein